MFKYIETHASHLARNKIDMSALNKLSKDELILIIQTTQESVVDVKKYNKLQKRFDGVNEIVRKHNEYFDVTYCHNEECDNITCYFGRDIYKSNNQQRMYWTMYECDGCEKMCCQDHFITCEECDCKTCFDCYPEFDFHESDCVKLLEYNKQQTN